MRDNAGQPRIFCKHLHDHIDNQTAQDIQKHLRVRNLRPKFSIQQKILHHVRRQHTASAKQHHVQCQF